MNAKTLITPAEELAATLASFARDRQPEVLHPLSMRLPVTDVAHVKALAAALRTSTTQACAKLLAAGWVATLEACDGELQDELILQSNAIFEELLHSHQVEVR